MKKKMFYAALISCLAVLTAGTVLADVPAPPTNQGIGFADTIFNNLTEADCRICHDDPAGAGATSNVERHHLLYYTPIRQGECSVSGNACLSDADCDSALCSAAPAEACSADSDCDDFPKGETCGEVCRGETVAPDLDANNDGINDGSFGCLNCHVQETVGGVTNFLVERDCLQCHVQKAGEGSVHHLLPMAQGLDSPLGDPVVGDCTPCHGSFVDDIGDGHIIPTYAPSLATPVPGTGTGMPLNSRGNGAGGCLYCHDTGTDTVSGVVVVSNADTHHNTGVFQSETGLVNDDACLWCHNLSLPLDSALRSCEGCHGLESLHNIQADSNGDQNIDVGNELPGYGHVGSSIPGANTDDCWGCHGFAMAADSAPGSGATIPFIASTSSRTVNGGEAASIFLIGSGFKNTLGASTWTSTVRLTASDGTVTDIVPNMVFESFCSLTIPGTLALGNYELQTVKTTDAVSNPVAITIKPSVVISSVDCAACSSEITISGSGFGMVPPDGTQAYYNVVQDGITLEVVSWGFSQIVVTGGSCTYTSLTVNTFYGSVTQP